MNGPQPGGPLTGSCNMAQGHNVKKALVGEKVGMTQVWDEDNTVIPVTVIKVTPCRVVQVKTSESHGYAAIQVTIGDKDPQKLNRPEAGHFATAGVTPGKKLVELRLEDVSGYEIGAELTADLFSAGEVVDAIGTSKGKGFAGVMKRHNFKGGRASHGAHLVHRMPGSIGQCATPSRVFKGKKMAGHMGGEQVTTQNLKIVSTDVENNIVLIKGAVPGAKGGTIIIRNAVKARS